MHNVYNVTYDPVAWCVSQTVTWLHCAKTAERIEVLSGVKTHGDPEARNIVLDGGPNPAMVTEVRCGLSQITLASWFLFYFDVSW